MILIATGDAALAKKIGGVLEGRKSYVITVRDDIEFRHKIYSNQPEIIIADVRLGGNRFEVMQELPRALANPSLKSHPAVILILPWASATAREAAAALGAFEVFSLDRRSWIRELPQAVSDALDARADGLLEPLKSELLH